MRLLVPLIFSLLCGGCVKHTVVLNGGTALPVSPPTSKRWHSTLLRGLIELDVTDARAICGNRDVVAIRNNENVLNGIVNYVTMNIYYSSMVKVWCGDSQNASLEAPAGVDAAVDAGAALLLDAQDRQSASLSR